MIMKCIVNTKYIREIVRPMDYSSQIEEESFAKIRDNSSQLLDKKIKEKKKKKMSSTEKFLFAFATVNVFRWGILAEGRWDRHEETSRHSRATFEPANSTETSDGPRMIRDD